MMDKHQNIAAAIGLVFALAFLIFWPRPVEAHEWYPLACCDQRDCYQIDPSEITATANGWMIEATGEIVPFAAVRQTPTDAGATFHRCSFGGDPQRSTIGLTSQAACVWVPPMGW